MRLYLPCALAVTTSGAKMRTDCGGCPIPCVCQYMMPCGDKCYTDCDDEGYWTPDRNTIEGKCGYGTSSSLTLLPTRFHHDMTMNRRVVVCTHFIHRVHDHESSCGRVAMRTYAGFKRVEEGGTGQAPASEMER
eukprot:COSAG01_NODE_2340_length_7871_cov_32.734431_9_plen_134_part_00